MRLKKCTAFLWTLPQFSVLCYCCEKDLLRSIGSPCMSISLHQIWPRGVGKQGMTWHRNHKLLSCKIFPQTHKWHILSVNIVRSSLLYQVSGSYFQANPSHLSNASVPAWLFPHAGCLIKLEEFMCISVLYKLSFNFTSKMLGTQFGALKYETTKNKIAAWNLFQCWSI